MARTSFLAVGLAAIVSFAAGAPASATTDPVLTSAEQMNVRSRPTPTTMGVPLFVSDGTPFPFGPPNEVVGAGLNGFTYPAGISPDQLITPSIPLLDDVQPGDANWLASQPGMLIVSVDLLQPLTTTDAPIAEVGVSYTLPGAEVLTASPFVFDPLIDRSNSLSILSIGGDEQVGHAVVSDQQWLQTTVPNPVWRSLPGSGERWTVGLPITATDVQITFATSDDGTLERLGSAVVVPAVPTEFLDLTGLVIDPAEVGQFELEITPVAATPVDPAPDDGTTGDVNADDPNEGPADDVATGDTPAEDTPADDAATGDTPADDTPAGEAPADLQPADDAAGQARESGESLSGDTEESADDSSGGSALPVIVTGAGVVLLLLIVGWFLLFKPKATDASGDDETPADPPNRIGRYAGPLGGPRWEHSAAALVAEARREGAPSNADGWWAPSNAAAHHAQSVFPVDDERTEELRRTAGEWSGTFVNEHTLEVVYAGGARSEELRREFGLDESPPPSDESMIELNEATMASAVGERVNILAESQEPDPEGVDWGGPPGSEIPLDEFEREEPGTPPSDPQERLRNTRAYSDVRGTHLPDELAEPIEQDGDEMGPIT